MKKFDTFRSITQEELNEANAQIVHKFGIRQKIESGSCQRQEYGKRIYHITIGDGVYISDTELRKIGETLMKIWRATAIYCMGMKIA